MTQVRGHGSGYYGSSEDDNKKAQVTGHAGIIRLHLASFNSAPTKTTAKPVTNMARVESIKGLPIWLLFLYHGPLPLLKTMAITGIRVPGGRYYCRQYAAHVLREIQFLSQPFYTLTKTSAPSNNTQA